MRRGRKTQVRLRMKPKKARWKTLKMKIASEAEVKFPMGTKAQNRKRKFLAPVAKITWQSHLFKPVLTVNGRMQSKVPCLSIKH